MQPFLFWLYRTTTTIMSNQHSKVGRKEEGREILSSRQMSSLLYFILFPRPCAAVPCNAIKGEGAVDGIGYEKVAFRELFATLTGGKLHENASKGRPVSGSPNWLSSYPPSQSANWLSFHPSFYPPRNWRPPDKGQRVRSSGLYLRLYSRKWSRCATCYEQLSIVYFHCSSIVHFQTVRGSKSL